MADHVPEADAEVASRTLAPTWRSKLWVAASASSASDDEHARAVERVAATSPEDRSLSALRDKAQAMPLTIAVAGLVSDLTGAMRCHRASPDRHRCRTRNVPVATG